ncbi:MAG: hypothetical protein DWQ06_15390 [Calditrichaeota bacterium]|nr:MAG: hypothetical protein DWQ06_15390 [Calditrichota bacterium]
MIEELNELTQQTARLRNVNHFIKKETIDKVKEAVRVLGTIIKNGETPPIEEISFRDSKFYYRKFINKKERGKFYSERRNLKKFSLILTFSTEHLTAIAKDSNLLKIAIDLFKTNWHYRFIYGLFFTLLEIWEDKRNSTILRSFLRTKIQENQNRNQRIKFLRDKSNYFFNCNGASVWAQEVVNSEIDLQDFQENNPQIKNYLSTSYFSEFIVSYTYQKIREEDFELHFESIFNFLEQNKNQTSLKKCLAKIIIWANEFGTVFEKEEIRQFAYEKIGDPTYESKWSSNTFFSENEKRDLEEAKDILNYWITEKIMDIFFGKIVQDTDRKEFWEKYLKVIRIDKIFVCPDIYYSEIRNDERIDSSFKERLGILKGGGKGSCAIIFGIKNYKFIEFGGYASGATQVCKSNNPRFPDFERITSYWNGSFQSVAKQDLVIFFQFENLVQAGTLEFYDEGRFVHLHGVWEERLESWLKEKLGV